MILEELSSMDDRQKHIILAGKLKQIAAMIRSRYDDDAIEAILSQRRLERYALVYVVVLAIETESWDRAGEALSMLFLLGYDMGAREGVPGSDSSRRSSTGRVADFQSVDASSSLAAGSRKEGCECSIQLSLTNTNSWR